MLVDAPRGDGIRERRLAGTYVVEHGVCRRAAAAPPRRTRARPGPRTRARGGARGRARVPRVELARGDRGVLALGAARRRSSRRRSVGTARAASSTGRPSRCGTRSCPATARACAPAGGLRVLPGHPRRPDGGAARRGGARGALRRDTISGGRGRRRPGLRRRLRPLPARQPEPLGPGSGPPRRPPRSSASRRPATARGAARRRRRGTASCTRPRSPRAPPRGTTRSTRGRRWSRCSATSARRGAASRRRRDRSPRRSCRRPSRAATSPTRARGGLSTEMRIDAARAGADALRAAASPVDVLVLRRTGMRAIANHDESGGGAEPAVRPRDARVFDAARLPRRGASWRSSRGRPSSSARTAPARPMSFASPRCATVVGSASAATPGPLKPRETPAITYVAVRAGARAGGRRPRPAPRRHGRARRRDPRGRRRQRPRVRRQKYTEAVAEVSKCS